jgi:ligand-binding SRPBCC domain-containing protein
VLAGAYHGLGAPAGFVDEQVRGPYRLWRHAHRFYDGGEGTIVEDTVQFRLPFGRFGDSSHPLVRLQLERILRFRPSAVRRRLLATEGRSVRKVTSKRR